MTQEAHAADEAVYTVAEVADRVKVIEETILRLLRAGDLRGFKVGASWRVYQSDLEDYIREHANWA